MQLDIRGRSLPLTPALDAYVERRMRFALGRFEPRMRRVTVRVGDENGPRGGVDKYCRAVVPTAFGTFVVEEKDCDLYAAIDRTSDRLGRMIGRAVLREHGEKGQGSCYPLTDDVLSRDKLRGDSGHAQSVLSPHSTRVRRPMRRSNEALSCIAR